MMLDVWDTDCLETNNPEYWLLSSLIGKSTRDKIDGVTGHPAVAMGYIDTLKI